MKAVSQAILKASRSQEPVLLCGETGTGKELVARVIHQIGPRREKPFLPVDCCALVPSLIETELFGHVRGAFTGAVHSRVGLFGAAQGGTVFLDEIAEMPIGLQGKLLRAIQERQFRRVGDTGWVSFNGRIIAASNRDLEIAVQEGSFRKDLFFRLNVLRIELPTLRQRKEDIPELADHFLAVVFDGHAERPQLSGPALECLLAYEWPGNVRELENCMRWAAAWGSGPLIYPDDLPPYVRKPQGSSPVSLPETQRSITLQEVERQVILRAIATAKGNKVTAARMLGIGKTTIYRKLKEYGISRFPSAGAPPEISDPEEP